MARQTAVEWLIEQLVELDKQLDGRRKSDDSTVVKFDPKKIYEQAKQMEKEQIITAYSMGYMWGEDEEVIKPSVKFGEQYYNDTFTSTPQGENPSATRTGQF